MQDPSHIVTNRPLQIQEDLLVNVILYEYFISFYAYFCHFNVASVVFFMTFADLELKSNFEENNEKD